MATGDVKWTRMRLPQFWPIEFWTICKWMLEWLFDQFSNLATYVLSGNSFPLRVETYLETSSLVLLLGLYLTAETSIDNWVILLPFFPAARNVYIEIFQISFVWCSAQNREGEMHWRCPPIVSVSQSLSSPSCLPSLLCLCSIMHSQLVVFKVTELESETVQPKVSFGLMFASLCVVP